MRFRTEIEVHHSEFRVDHRRPGFIAGSCFSEKMYKRLLARKFPVTANPTGILFNPLSVAAMLRRLHEGALYERQDLHTAEGLWFSYDHHGNFCRPTPTEALTAINDAMEAGMKALCESRYVILTWGTAWIYRLADSGAVAANCHKQPSTLFLRERLSPESIVNEYTELLKGPLAGKQVLVTVSPVRHLKDGFDGNCLSKSILRIAAALLAEMFPDVYYFPSFEIMNDDLRDYRFYAEDMVHPSDQAVDYIWEKFIDFSMDEDTRRMLPHLERLSSAVSHRIISRDSDAVRRFADNSIGLIDDLQRRLPCVDFSAEREYFQSLVARLR